MKIGIIGYGIVGKATEVLLRKYYSPRFKLIIYDPKLIDSRYSDMENCSTVFICVPTPADPETGKCNTSIVEEAVAAITRTEKLFNIVIRSTVPPGTCEYLQQKYKHPILLMPEFLTESTWWEDAENPHFLVIGGEYYENSHKVMMLFEHFSIERKFIVDLATASVFKYAINCLFATKVVFANAMYDVAQQCGADWSKIVNIMYQHPWIGSNHLEVWHKGKRGYDGRCLPKDVKAIAYGFDNKLLQFIDQYNNNIISGNEKA